MPGGALDVFLLQAFPLQMRHQWLQVLQDYPSPEVCSSVGVQDDACVELWTAEWVFLVRRVDRRWVLENRLPPPRRRSRVPHRHLAFPRPKAHQLSVESAFLSENEVVSTLHACQRDARSWKQGRQSGFGEDGVGFLAYSMIQLQLVLRHAVVAPCRSSSTASSRKLVAHLSQCNA